MTPVLPPFLSPVCLLPCRLCDPERPTDFPPEAGPFVFVPDPYTRKQ